MEDQGIIAAICAHLQAVEQKLTSDIARYQADQQNYAALQQSAQEGETAAQQALTANQQLQKDLGC